MGRCTRPLSVLQRSGLLARPFPRRLRQMGGMVVQVSGLACQRTALRTLAEHAEPETQEKVAGYATFELGHERSMWEGRVWGSVIIM